MEKNLREVFEEYDLAAAYLFGSFARGEEHSSSDIDIAVLFKSFDARKLLELSRNLNEEVDLDRELDVRALNDADLVFRKNVVSEGDIIYEGDRERRMIFEEKTFKNYIDMKPHIEHYREMRSERLA